MKRRPFIYAAASSALLVLDVAAVVLLARWIASHGIWKMFLDLPLAFLFLHASMVAILLSGLAFRKVRKGALDRSIGRLEPELHRMFSEYAYSSGEPEEIRAVFRQKPRSVEHLLVGFMPSVTGDARERLGQLGVDLGLIAKWKAMARSKQFLRRKTAAIALSSFPLTLTRDSLSDLLQDPKPEIGILAARALVQTGEQEVIEQIFNLILNRTLLVRALVTEDLRKYAAMLSQIAVPNALLEADEKRTGIVLGILGAWQRSISLDGWECIYEKTNPENRVSILNLLPYIITAQQPESLVIRALNDQDEKVRSAASALVGRWQLAAALPALSDLLRRDNVDIARAAAKALTNLGHSGNSVLENAILDADGGVGRIALEALERMAIAR